MANSPRARPSKANTRPDHNGTQRAQFESNKRKIFATQEVCGICGQRVDFAVKWPDPMSPCIDHIIPVAKGGHPSDIDNLQLAHMCCNRQKSDKLTPQTRPELAAPETVDMRDLPQTFDWKSL
ncbi:MAG: HNH endonuclease [Oscillospiraceae bacterium]|nr:HNH endonuclease [Oscillospiraceae bacterium]